MGSPFYLLAFALSRFQAWLVPLAGFVATGIILLVGQACLGRRRSSPPAPRPTSPATAADPTYDPFVRGSATERRASLRRGGKAIKALVTDAEAKQPPVEAWVVDRSMGGLCLSVARPVEKGTFLSVRALDAPRTVPWVQVEVKSCWEVDGSWNLGCKFLRTPPWSILLLFG